MEFTLRAKIIGDGEGDFTRLTWFLGDFTEPVDYAAVQSAANQILGALDTISDGVVSESTITALHSQSSVIPADADTTDELVISVFINATGETPKYATIRVPAPVDGVWEANNVTLDKTNADVIQYVQQVGQHSVISDGESINLAVGSGGINKGYFRSRPKTLGK